MTISFIQIKAIIKKFRNLLCADNATPLVEVIDEDLDVRHPAPSQNLNEHLPYESARDHAYREITARPTPDAGRTYDPDSGNGRDIKAAVDIDLPREDQLEDHASGMQIPPETLEKWIAAGILCPDEIRAAEKLLKMIRQKRHDNRLRHP